MKRIACISLAALALLVLMAASASAEPKFVVLTGHELRIGLTGGDLRCVGGEPTGGFPLCTPGTRRVMLRGATQTTSLHDVTGDHPELMSGTNTATVNCNLDDSYAGHCWGTFKVDLTAGGTWEGSWRGELDMINQNSSYTATGHGEGGDIDGMRSNYEAASSGSADATFTVRINTR